MNPAENEFTAKVYRLIPGRDLTLAIVICL